MKFVIGRALTILSWDNPVTAFFRKSRKLRHSLGRPSRSDFVQFGFALLDKGAEQVNLKSFKYYDRMLPAQDSLSDNSSLGNLIALPLQGKALQDGNSAFIDGNWNAYPDQWRILFSKPRLSQEFLEEKIKKWTNPIEDIAANADESDREKPWNRMQIFNKNDVDGRYILHYQMEYMWIIRI